jgi:acetate kinase
MKILVINAGSSSLKYQLIDMENEHLLAKGICEQIGDDNATFTHKVPDNEAKNIKEPHAMANHGDAIQLVLDTLVSADHGVIASMSEIGAVGHRVLHGGEKFSASVLVNDAVKEAIKECFKFGPLHNPANLKGIEACEAIMDVPQVAVFDTGFHQTMPDYAYMYALPYEFYEKDGIRRYGFHGTSHRFVSGRCIELLGGKAEGTKIVTCHLGNGSSIAAVNDGKCFDTTIGLTPLEGILMGTRCGSIDPAIVPTIMKSHNLTPDEMDTLMNKKSGMLGLTGTSDNRTIEQRAKDGDERAKLVESMLCHQLTKYIGGFAAAMGGVDAVVFTGGIGENNPQYRTRVGKQLEFLGTKVDEEKNACRGKEVEFSVEGSKVKLFVIPTNEELVIARDTLNIVNAL